MGKARQNSPTKRIKNGSQGIPDLSLIQANEKLTAPAPVKLYPSLREWVRRHGGSTFIRSLIEQAKLKEEAT